MSTFRPSYDADPEDPRRHAPVGPPRDARQPLMPEAMARPGFMAASIHQAEAARAAAVAHALGDAAAWWASEQHLSSQVPLPMDVERAKDALHAEATALESRIAKRRAEAARLREMVHIAENQLRDLDRQILQEKQRIATAEAAALEAADTARQVAELELAQAEVAALVMTRHANDDAQSVAAAEQASAAGRARTSRVDKAAAKDATPEQAAATRSVARERTALVIREAERAVEWRAEPEVAGVRMPPAGMFAHAIPQPAMFSRVVGALGLMSAVRWDAFDATAVATRILDAQVIPSSTRGGHYRHVAHGVLSKPLEKTHAVQAWTDATAMRAARHYLRALGVDPDRHHVVVFAHSQQRPLSKDRMKVEEAVHVLWSRVRDDGAVHACDHAFIAAAVGRARYDVAAGLDPERISMTLSRKAPILAGLQALADGTLQARYVHPLSKQCEIVALQGAEHLRRLAHEGYPEAGDFAGTWTPKPGYRHAMDIQRIMDHLRMGN